MRRAVRGLLLGSVAAILGTSVTATRAGDEGEPEPRVTIDMDAAPASEWLGVHHYGVFRGEARVGWLRRSLERGEHEGHPAVVRSFESFVDVAGDGNAVRSTERAVYVLEAPQQLAVIERRTEAQGRVHARTATRREGRFDVVTTRDGEEVTGKVAALDVTLADELVTERLVAAAVAHEGDPTGTVERAVALDLARMRLVRREVSLRGTETAEDGAALYLVSVARGPDEWTEPMVVDAHGALVRGAMGGGLTLRRMTKQAALADLGRTSIEVAERVPMDARLGDVLTLRTLVISMPAPADGAPAPFPDTGRQTSEVVDGRLRLRIDVARDAGEPSDAEREAALAPQGGIDSDAPQIVAAVNSVLRGTSRPAVRVARLLAFTAGHLEDAVVMEEPRASELLRARRGDCTEHTRLFVALSRAAGIPAREVTGLIWLGDEQRSFGWHSWAEVELAGRWRPVDPTSGLTPAHAAHIRVDPAARAAGVLSGIRFELVEATR